ncbi:2-oxoglutarate-dependent dioxygenase 19-like [Malania oleifera]|uniref:2-oxoglutarate-dependent dioxygenase 19-like n=1 Tax=Malania oleifera TaxID=397392 RepID=UPI0025AEB72F|nr:2-oxoglutarate-dependent dioxygenase 19-like [Malania oleifera]
MPCVKGLVESGCLTSIPSKYVFPRKSGDDSMFSEAEAIIPTIDLSLLTGGTPYQRSKVIQDLANACLDWGFFMVVNHGVPKKVMDDMVSGCLGFFDLTEEEKQEYAGKQLFDPIRSGTSFNLTVDDAFLWRDYLKIHVHPNFHAPTKPADFSEISEEYCRKAREVASELLKGISEGLGLEESYIVKTMEVDKGSQLLVANLYPPCPQPEVVMGLPPHSDHGLLTLLIQNDVSGLQVLHRGKWVPVNPLPNSFLVNTGDHMEILTNGKYKSVVHRVVVNEKATRISIGTAHGPPLDAIVSPSLELGHREGYCPTYHALKYREYMELQQSRRLDGKSCLDRIKVHQSDHIPQDC